MKPTEVNGNMKVPWVAYGVSRSYGLVRVGEDERAGENLWRATTMQTWSTIDAQRKLGLTSMEKSNIIESYFYCLILNKIALMK